MTIDRRPADVPRETSLASARRRGPRSPRRPARAAPGAAPATAHRLPRPRPHAPGHHRRQPEGRGRQDHHHRQHRARRSRCTACTCSSSTSTRRATRRTALGVSTASGTPSVYDVLLGEITVGRGDQTCPARRASAACRRRSTWPAPRSSWSRMVARETRLKKALASRRSTTSTSTTSSSTARRRSGLLTVNAMVAARRGAHPDPVRVLRAGGPGPAAAQHRAGPGAPEPDLDVSTILLTMYDGAHQARRPGRQRGARRTSATGAHAPSIPRSVKVSEAPGFGQSVMTYDPARAAR